ncbi:LysR substrate-binding domain-containing protein [Shinella oryzae]|uniref:LysR substrate-binding domain-containing protein n=1 Tax=Shinella oryzae TaxID=2871820 RepID=A0ABY9KCB0_9HYPH|nr:LysR substrate-binding domain-containing protein [Shinella oryzae]WLS05309.1 LysR substrate-binding domain-containing protein [Shinella oryzae]
MRHLRYFVAVAEELHFGRAAARLNIVQPALTAQIKALEAILGVELLARSKRHVELTEAGREFLRESHSAIAQVEAAVDTAVDIGRGAAGSIRIGYGANAAITGMISTSIRRFRAEWPGVSLSLKEMPSNSVQDALIAGEVDIGYAVATDVRITGANSKRIGQWHWMLALADDHPLSGRGAISVAQVLTESFAVYAEADGRSTTVGVMSSIPDMAPGHIHRTSHVTGLMAYVASGLGISFVPASMSVMNFPGVVFRPLAEALPPMEMYIFWRSDASPAARNYVGLLEAT